jgi:hypothetical protein
MLGFHRRSVGSRAAWNRGKGLEICNPPAALLGRLFLPKLIESLILEKPASKSPNRLFRIHLANNTRRMPNTTTATQPRMIRVI